MNPVGARLWRWTIGLAAALLPLPSLAQEPAPPNVEELLAATPLAPYAGVWIGEVHTQEITYVVRMTIQTRKSALDGTDGQSLRANVVEPAELGQHAMFASSVSAKDGRLAASIVGPYYDVLKGLINGDSGFGYLKDGALSADGATLTARWNDGGAEFHRLVPRIASFEIAPEVQAGLSLDRLEKHWKILRDRGNWGYLDASPPLRLRLHAADLPPVGNSPGLVLVDDPLMEMNSAKVTEDGVLELRWMLWPGVQPGRKRVLIAGGAVVEFDLAITGMEGNPPRPQPQILAATAIDEVLPPYPSEGATQTRKVFVAGLGLPKTRIEGTLAKLTSADPSITYDFAWTPDDAAGAGSTAAHDFALGWRATGLAPSDEVGGVVLLARLQSSVLPGRKGLEIDGAFGRWSLDFLDNSGTIRIVRGTRDEEFETATALILGEAFMVELSLQTPIPRSAITLRLAPFLKGGQSDQEVDVAAVLVSQEGGTALYRTEPLSLAAPGAPKPEGAALIKASAGGTLIATLLDPEVARVTPPAATAEIVADPRDLGATWDDYLEQTSQCAGLTLEQARTKLTTTVDYTWNWLLTYDLREYLDKAGFRFVEILALGDHTAALLLRDAFVTRMKEVRAGYAKVLENDAAVRAFRLRFAAERYHEDLPLNQVPITAADGSHALFADVHSPETYARELDAAGRLAWQDKATREGLQTFIKSMAESIRIAEGVDRCNAAGLVQIAAFSFEEIVAGVTPRLMKEVQAEDGALSWVPDRVARGFVGTLYIAGEAIRAAEQQARIARGTFALAFIAPLSIAGAHWLAAEELAYYLYAAAAATPDAAIAVADLANYFGDQQELAFAAGATDVIGADRLEEIRATAPGWMSATMSALGVASPAAIVGLGKLSAIAKARALADFNAAAGRGARLASRLTPDALQAMTEAQRTDLAAYLTSLKAREIADGADKLNDAERAALAGAETLSKQMPAFKPRPPTSSGFLSEAEAGQLRQEQLVALQPLDGAPELVPGTLLGRGGFNEVYELAGRPTRALRVRRRADQADEAYEAFGRGVLQDSGNGFDPNVVRVAEIERTGRIGAEGGTYAGRYYEVVERMPGGSAAQQLPGQPMTAGQAIAFDEAARALNAKGFAWMDCHTGNFSFVRKPGGGPDDWSVVIIDPAGIVPVKPTATGSTAENARYVQQRMSQLDEMTLYAHRRAQQQWAQAHAIEDTTARARALEQANQALRTLGQEAMDEIMGTPID